MRYILWANYKWYIIGGLLILLMIAFVLIFLYSLPVSWHSILIVNGRGVFYSIIFIQYGNCARMKRISNSTAIVLICIAVFIRHPMTTFISKSPFNEHNLFSGRCCRHVNGKILKLFEIKSYINQLKWSDQGQVLHSQKFEDEPKFPPNIISVLELKNVLVGLILLWCC